MFGSARRAARRRLAASLTACALAASSGCGGTDARSGDDDRRAVQERTAAYASAYVRGDGERACAQLTSELRRVLEARARGFGARSCREIYERVGSNIRLAFDEHHARLVQMASDPRRVHVELAGDRAKAGFAAAGDRGVPRRVELVRVGDRWLIDKVGTRADARP